MTAIAGIEEEPSHPRARTDDRHMIWGIGILTGAQV
jgi:hypothetical protein